MENDAYRLTHFRNVLNNSTNYYYRIELLNNQY